MFLHELDLDQLHNSVTAALLINILPWFRIYLFVQNVCGLNDPEYINVYIYIYSFNRLHKDNCKTRRETFKVLGFDAACIKRFDGSYLSVWNSKYGYF